MRTHVLLYATFTSVVDGAHDVSISMAIVDTKHDEGGPAPQGIGNGIVGAARPFATCGLCVVGSKQ
jgi:hypothetical protein